MRLTMDQKRAVSGRLAERYRGCKSRKDRSRILDELVQLSGNFGKRGVVRHPGGDVVERKNTRHRAVRARKYDEVVEKEVAFHE